MAGDQKTAAQKRTEALLAKDPDHFRKLAARKKGKPNSSSTKFKKGDKRTKQLASKGGKKSALERFKLHYEELPSAPKFDGRKVKKS